MEQELSEITARTSTELIKAFNSLGISPDNIISILRTEQYVLFYKKDSFIEIEQEIEENE